MKTVGIDTNAILTYRLKRSTGFAKIHDTFEKCADGKIKVYISIPTILETEWVLRSYYKQPKKIILEFLEELLHLPNLLTDKKDDVKFALNLYKQSTVSFTDCLIITSIQSNHCHQFLTFDNKLLKLYQTLQ